MLPALFTPGFLNQLGLLQFKTKRAFLGSRQGGHISPRKGHGIEFSEYRSYELGDNPRHIDWGVYGRTDRLYIKRFLEEEDLSVLIMLDTSRSMFEPNVEQKWHRARDIALALSYVALSEHDTVRLCALGSYYSPRMTTPRGVYKLSDELDAVEKNENIPIGRELTPHIIQACALTKTPGVAILISDCFVDMYELQTALNILRAKNLLITIVHVIGESDLQPLQTGESGWISDSENQERIEISWSAQDQIDYQKRLELHMSAISQFCRSSGVRYTQLLPDMKTEEFILKQLPTLGILS